MKRLKRGLFSGFWHAMIEVPADTMTAAGDNNPFPYLIGNVLQQVRGGPDAPDAADTQFFQTINGISEKLDKTLPGGPLGFLLKILILGTAVPHLIITAEETFAEVNVKRPLQKLFRPELAGAQEVVVGWRRGLYDAKERDDKLATLGVPDDEMALLIQVAEQQPQLALLLEWFHKGLLAGDGDKKLSAQDGLAEFQKAAAPLLLRAGIPADDVARYWASHWQLPGVQLAVEMFRRGLIQQTDLDAILSQQQVHPAWRANMVAAMGQLLPVRIIASLMHAGVLTDARALQEYKAHGYDDERAALMIQYAHATDPKAVNKAALHPKLKDLSESQLMGSYVDGLLTREKTKAQLVVLGYDAGEAEAILQLADHQQLLVQTRQTVEKTRQLYLAAQLDDTQVKSVLGGAGLPATFVEQKLAAWKKEGAVDIALLDKSDVLGLYHKSIIDASQAAAELSRIGYGAGDVALLLDSHTPAAPKPAKAPKGGTP